MPNNFNIQGDKEPRKVPQNYLKDLKEKVVNQIGVDMDMIDIAADAPLLSAIGKKRGFTIPDSYIEKLSNRLLATKDEQPTAKLIQLNPWIKNIAVAASIALFGAYFVFNIDLATDTASSTSFADQLENVDDDLLYAYLEENVDALDTDLLTEYGATPDYDLSQLEDEDLQDIWDEENHEIDIIEIENYLEL
jgi:hypothetical protein